MVKDLPANTIDAGSIPVQEAALKKKLATPSSILVWRIPWTEKSGRLHSMGSLKSRLNNNIFLFHPVIFCFY